MGKKNNFSTTFLRFSDAEYGLPIIKYNEKLGYSVPIEAMLIKRTIRGTNKIQFAQKEKKINEYLEDSTNIITINFLDGVKDSMFLRLYFDYPEILAVSAITEDGTSIPAKRIDHMEYLDFSSIHYEVDKPITVYITANEQYVANEFVFRIRIQTPEGDAQ